MYKQILAAVDGSRTSEIALQEAIKLAKDQDATLRIVHVVDKTVAYFDSGLVNIDIGELWDDIEKGGQEVLKRAAAFAKEAGVRVETKLLVLDQLGRRVSDMIEEEASAWPADLIVLGTHGRRGITHVMLGSVAEHVVRIASKPVLLIRGH